MVSFGYQPNPGNAGFVYSSNGQISPPTFQLSIAKQASSGFYNWSDTFPYYDDSVIGSFTLLKPFVGYINGVQINVSAPQTITGFMSGNCYYVYVDNTGILHATTTYSDSLVDSNILLLKTLRDSSLPSNNQISVNKSYSAEMGKSTKLFLRANLSPTLQYDGGGAIITLNGANKLAIVGNGNYWDCTIKTPIPDSAGIPIIWNQYYTNSSGKWARYSQSNAFLSEYNNAGTPTTAPHYCVYTLYVTKENVNTTAPQYFAVMDASSYANQTQASNAITSGTIAQATNELLQLNLQQLGYITLNNSNTITSVVVAKSVIKQVYSST